MRDEHDREGGAEDGRGQQDPPQRAVAVGRGPAATLRRLTRNIGTRVPSLELKKTWRTS